MFDKRVVYQGGGIRDFQAVEFWIVPENATKPEPTPDYLDYDLIVCCPTIEIKSDKIIYDKKLLLIFSVQILGEGSCEEEFNFDWKVSSGKILEGQGSSVIKVDAKGAKEITATVEIGGLCEECVREATFTTKIQ